MTDAPTTPSAAAKAAVDKIERLSNHDRYSYTDDAEQNESEYNRLDEIHKLIPIIDRCIAEHGAGVPAIATTAIHGRIEDGACSVCENTADPRKCYIGTTQALLRTNCPMYRTGNTFVLIASDTAKLAALEAKLKRVRAALRVHVIDDVGPMRSCGLCELAWLATAPEQHRADCPAKPERE